MSEIWETEQELQRKEKGMEAFGQSSGHAGLVVPCSVSGQLLPKGASSESTVPRKKTKGKQKPWRHPGLPSEKKQKYYTSYLVHL